ncbi:MAG: sulfate transporter CysZ [Granulosicoccaceae bacterium]
MSKLKTPAPSGLITQLAQGTGYLMRGFQLIRQPGLRRFVAVPLTINVVIFGSLIWALFSFTGALIASISGALDLGFLGDWAIVQGVIWLVQLLVWLVVGIGVLVGVFYTFSLVANFLAAPFNSLLAEKVEKHLAGELVQGEEGWGHALKAIPHVMMSELFKLLYLLMWMVPLVLLWLFTLFIPGLNLVSTAAWLWFGAWLLSLEYVDYPAGNHGLTFPKVRKLMKQHRPSAIGFGGAVTLMTSIPLLNLIAMPCAVAGATALWHERLRDHELTALPK